MMRFLSVLAVASAVLCLAVSMAISPKAPYPLTVFELQAENPPSKDINMKENVMNLHQGKWDINQATAEQLMQVEALEKSARRRFYSTFTERAAFPTWSSCWKSTESEKSCSAE